MLCGPDDKKFKWDQKPNDLVKVDVKEEIRQLLAKYAEEHAIPLTGENAVKIALRRGRYWVSHAGGVSKYWTPGFKHLITSSNREVR